ncbi:hypothetical protein [Marispirochaeta aestuarii]|uniref:hypothetical protein n=1 Tax=Marispirochaeta aestuarii TaxID=1963862 RepID=UPI0029C62CA3|nr:hypothetical protein [Marispirochaeta aestuarii]
MKERLKSTGVFSIAVTLVFVVLLGGCGESGLMDIYAASSAVRLSTIPAGSVINPGDQIPLSLTVDSGSALPEILVVRIYRDGNSLVSTMDHEVESSIVLVETDDLVPGFYRITAFSGISEDPETELELPFFISSGAGGIQRISAYPSTVLPGEGMVLFADLAEAPADDPYIRWKAGGRTIGAGRVAEGAQLANWQVPETPGIYPVTAEYFPFPPPGNGDFPFPGAEKRSEAFVSMEQRTPRGELGPAESYSSLFHFRGTFQSNGFSVLPDPRIQGSPVLALEDEIFGYSFSEKDALAFDTSLIPVRNGNPEAFVLEMKGIFSRNGTILSIRDQRDVQVLSLQRSDEGFLLAGDNFQISLSLPLSFTLRETVSPLYLAIAVEPGSPSGRLRWYVDGVYQGSAVLPGIPGFSGTGFSTLIGGGFHGLLDELGIRSIEAARDGGIFGFAMRERYGRSLVLAEGFDASWPDELLLPGSTGRGEGSEESVLLIEKGGKAGFAVPLQGIEGRIILTFKEPAAGGAVRFRLGGEESDSVNLITKADGRATLLILRRERNLRISQDENLLASFSADESGGDLQLWIEAADESLRLDSILVSRGEERFRVQAPGAEASPEV